MQEEPKHSGLTLHPHPPRVMWQDWESSRRVCQTLLEAKAYTQLVDFDAHLDDIRRDWTNQQLNAEIAQLMSVANGSA